jgi:hypothetical protein
MGRGGFLSRGMRPYFPSGPYSHWKNRTGVGDYHQPRRFSVSPPRKSTFATVALVGKDLALGGLGYRGTSSRELLIEKNRAL